MNIKLSKLIKKAEGKYNQGKISDNKNDSKKSWKMINELMGRTNKKITLETYV